MAAVSPDKIITRSNTKEQALYIIISARRKTVSYNNNLRGLIYSLPDKSHEENLIIVYP